MVAAVVSFPEALTKDQAEDLPSAHLPLLAVILGPTASGKTALSLALAKHFDGEIVSCDSVAVYREFEIGTAKPSLEQRKQAPHHMLDVASPADHYTAGEYSRAARAALAEIAQRGRLPILVGGTGLYLRALIDGLFAGPERSEKLRTRLRTLASRRGVPHLHKLLRRMDALAAERIHPNDEPKLVRALEVCLLAKAPMSQLWTTGRDRLEGFRVLRIGLDPEREALYTRINQRAKEMFDQGLIEETRALQEKYGGSAWALSSLGYRQAVEHLKGRLDLAGAITSAQQGHRNYAKRQMTWFRREPAVHWMHGFGDDLSIQQQTRELIASRR